MIGRHPVFQSGGKEKLLAVIGSDWLCHRFVRRRQDGIVQSFETVSAERPYREEGVRVRSRAQAPGWMRTRTKADLRPRSFSA